MWKSVWFFAAAVNNTKNAGFYDVENTAFLVEKNVDKTVPGVDKWKTYAVYARRRPLIPSRSSRSLSFVDNSRVMVSTPCIIVVWSRPPRDPPMSSRVSPKLGSGYIHKQLSGPGNRAVALGTPECCGFYVVVCRNRL